MILMSCADFFLKIKIYEKKNQEHYQSVKWFGSYDLVKQRYLEGF